MITVLDIKSHNSLFISSFLILIYAEKHSRQAVINVYLSYGPS